MAHIRFVREYDWYGRKYYDVVYKDRIFTRSADELPKSVRDYIEQSRAKEQYDTLCKRKEIIYEK